MEITLRETVKALEIKNILVNIDLGVHYSCSLASNCPVAIKLREYISASEITLENLLEGYSQISTPSPVLPIVFQPINSMLTVDIGVEQLRINMKTVLEEQCFFSIQNKIKAIEREEQRVRQLELALYTDYQRAYLRMQKERRLFALYYSLENLKDNDAFYTCSEDFRRYLFYFKTQYAPEYLIQNRVRSEICPEHKEEIKRDCVYIEFCISPDYKILGVNIVEESGENLSHYHGNSDYTCWGDVTFPPIWDRTLSSLRTITNFLSKSLVTINMNSLLSRKPYQMPHTDTLVESADELGEEGSIGDLALPEERAVRWGARRR